MNKKMDRIYSYFTGPEKNVVRLHMACDCCGFTWGEDDRYDNTRCANPDGLVGCGRGSVTYTDELSGLKYPPRDCETDSQKMARAQRAGAKVVRNRERLLAKQKQDRLRGG